METKQLDALKRLWVIAQGTSGQCRRVAGFLLCLYNGQRFPFDMTEFRGLDSDIFNDCIQVLILDYTPKKEIHELLNLSSEDFEKLAIDWQIEAKNN